MPDIELKGQIICVFGLPNTGKSNMLRWLLRRPPYRRNLIIDPVRDYPPGDYGLVFRPSSRQHSSDGGNCEKEVDEVIDMMINRTEAKFRPKFVVIDEANRVLKNNQPIPPALADLIDFNTHYSPPVSLICACRRPAKLHTNIREIANHFFILSSGGKNDNRSYGNIASELPDVLDRKEPYEIAHVDSYRRVSVFSPVENMGEKGRI